MRTRSDEDLLDLEILDAVAGLFARLVAEGEGLAKSFGIPVFVIKALHMLDTPLAMKDLGHRMHCDPSFITSIADTLEKHGLAAREPDPADRRVKRLVLTPAGAELKARIEDEVVSVASVPHPGAARHPAGPGPHHEPAAIRGGLPRRGGEQAPGRHRSANACGRGR